MYEGRARERAKRYKKSDIGKNNARLRMKVCYRYYRKKANAPGDGMKEVSTNIDETLASNFLYFRFEKDREEKNDGIYSDFVRELYIFAVEEAG